MNVDIRQLEHLNYLFSQMMGDIFLAPYSNQTFNEMTGAQKKILHFLDHFGPQKMSEVAHQVSVTTAAATGVVDKLVKAGLVERVNDPSDRRVIRVGLTPLGKRTIKTMKKIYERRLEEVLQKLDEPKRRKLIASFEHIHQLLSEIRDADGNSH